MEEVRPSPPRRRPQSIIRFFIRRRLHLRQPQSPPPTGGATQVTAPGRRCPPPSPTTPAAASTPATSPLIQQLSLGSHGFAIFVPGGFADFELKSAVGLSTSVAYMSTAPLQAVFSLPLLLTVPLLILNEKCIVLVLIV